MLFSSAYFHLFFTFQQWAKSVPIRSSFWSIFSRTLAEYGPEKTPQGYNQKRKFFLTNSFVLVHSPAKNIYNEQLEVVHLPLPPHIIPLQVKSQSMLHHGSVGASIKQNKRNLNKPNPNPNPSCCITFCCITFCCFS